MRDYIKVNQQAYDELSCVYEKRAVEKSDDEERITNIGDSVLRLSTMPMDRITILEVGPGSGEMLLYFEEKSCRTFAVELSHKMACVAQKKSPKSIILIGDVLEFEFLDNSFDIIYAGALIHLFPFTDALELLSKFYKWLKPEGVLFVNTTIYTSSEEGYFQKNDYGGTIKRFRKHWTESELSESIIATGYKIVDRRFTDERNRQKKWVAFFCKKVKV